MCRIFTLFSHGESPRAIARLLNSEGVPGPGGRPWGDTTIRGHFERGTGILRNELYIGRLVWNRLRYLKDPVSGKRRSRLNPPTEWLIEDVPHLRIIEEPLWEAVRQRLRGIRDSERVRNARSTRFWEHRRARHLLTEKAFRGVCGGTLASIGADHLACGKARRTGTCENRRSIRRGMFESVILDALKNQLMAPDLVAEFIDEFHRQVNRQRHGAELQRTAAQAELTAVRRKLDGLVDAIAAGLLAAGLRAAGLQQRLDDLIESKRCADTIAVGLDGVRRLSAAIGACASGVGSGRVAGVLRRRDRDCRWRGQPRRPGRFARVRWLGAGAFPWPAFPAGDRARPRSRPGSG